MASVQQMMSVAQNCPGFEPQYNSTYVLSASVATESCMGCDNFKNEKCQKNLFDKVLAGLDTV